MSAATERLEAEVLTSLLELGPQTAGQLQRSVGNGATLTTVSQALSEMEDRGDVYARRSETPYVWAVVGDEPVDLGDEDWARGDR